MAKELNSKNPQNSREKEEKKVLKDEKGRFMKGTAKPKNSGIKLGTKHFGTDFDEVIKEIAKANKISESDARKLLIKKAYSEAKNGNFPFYKDICDRYYGKAQENIDLTTDGEKIQGINYIIPNGTDNKTNT